MTTRNARRGQQRRQKAYRDRHDIKMTTAALRPAIHVPLAYLKAQHEISLVDVLGMGLRVYKDLGYFNDEALAEFEELCNPQPDEDLQQNENCHDHNHQTSNQTSWEE